MPRFTTGHLKAVAPATPAHIIEALMNQKEASAAIRIETGRQNPLARIHSHATAFILNLPDQPVGSEDATHAQTLACITAIAMPDGIHQGFLQTQLKAAGCFFAGHRLQQQLQKRTELKCGGKDEISPAKPWHCDP